MGAVGAVMGDCTENDTANALDDALRVRRWLGVVRGGWGWFRGTWGRLGRLGR